MPRRHVLSSLSVLAAALLVAGCGGKSSTSTVSTADWAGSVCTALTTWKTSIDSTLRTLRSDPISITSLQTASDQVGSANKTLADTLEQAGKPDTSAGEKAMASLGRFQTQITAEQDKISTAVEEAFSAIPLPDAIPTAVPVVLGSFKALGTALRGLSGAFDRAGACRALS